MSDSIPNASVAVASSNHSKDFSKKKRANRSAKLKQSKLDVRREQWLSQVNKKGGCKVGTANGCAPHEGPPVHLRSTKGGPVEKLDIETCNEEIYEPSIHHYSDSESLPSNSPTSHTSSVLCRNESGVNFTASSRSSSSSSGRSSSSSGRSYSDDEDGRDAGGVDDDGDDDCLDDWEAVADALEAKDEKHQGLPSPKHETAMGVDNLSGNSESGGEKGILVNCCAWRPDDTCRPQNLPNLSKQYSLPLNSERHFGRGSVWGCKNVGPDPTSCPICFEDFDCTDSSFLPCTCGFRLCLFCHKRILEEDGRCPGCRKKYECKPAQGEATLDGGSLIFRLARSCSMITRS
ncbi:RING/U-box superfamily protein [Striga hermonthica]|uniref:RING/U-box superfamily protein n=1 Tax=Striga hermonthica TaxID=68872 RepID=A0A9N7NIV8_STRHE|nr:RING/U-box superfamily protein [Striga hermonthica]